MGHLVAQTIVSYMTHCKDVKLLKDPGPVRPTLNESGSTVKSDDGSVQLRI